MRIVGGMNMERFAGGLDCKQANDSRNYHRTKMQKELIIQRLKEKGCRITKQRKVILDIILAEECSCCKEIYYKASNVNLQIGIATVYRMINVLEEVGAISRRRVYKVTCSKDCDTEDACTIELDDNTIHHLSTKKLNMIIQTGLKACGYLSKQGIRSVLIRQSGMKI